MNHSRIEAHTPDEALARLRGLEVTEAFTELPLAVAFSPCAVAPDGEHACADVLDSNGTLHHLDMPAGFARAVLSGDANAHAQLERIIRATWN